jgi:hypothetical protein
MECVVSSKGVLLGERPSPANERIRDLDEVELTIETQQIGHRPP